MQKIICYNKERKVINMKDYNDREFIMILNNNGYRHIRSRGSHAVYSNGVRTLTINKGINRMVVRRLVKEYDLEMS